MIDMVRGMSDPSAEQEESVVVTPVGQSDLLEKLKLVEESREAYSDALHKIIGAVQHALGLAYLAKINETDIDPDALIACLTGQDAPSCPDINHNDPRSSN